MPRPRFQRLPADKQQHILAVAARHFAADGFDNASLNRILDEADVSKGAAYYYFDDKGDLFATVVEDAWERISAELWPEGGFDPSTLDGPDFWDQAFALYARQIAVFHAMPDASRMIKALPEALHDPSVSRLAPRFEALMGALVHMLELGRSKGNIRDDLPLDLLMEMLSGLDNAIDRWLIDHPEALRDDPTLAARTFGALRGLLEPPASGRS